MVELFKTADKKKLLTDKNHGSITFYTGTLYNNLEKIRGSLA